MNAHNDVLLSHRLRGFDRNDSTVAGLKRALDKGVAHIEFDVRVTADDKFLVVHDGFVPAHDGARLPVCRHSYADIRNQAAQPDLALLDDMLAVACGHTANSTARLYIDLKDTGCEAALLQLVDGFGLSHRVVYVSWIARAMFEINRLDPAAKLCFSHWTFFRFPALFGAGATAAAATCRIARAVPASSLATLRLFAEPRSDPRPNLPEALWRGYNHAHLLKRGVAGDMARILRASGGMICVPIRCASHSLVETMHAQGLQVAVFEVTTPEETAAVRKRIGPDIIFCDDAGQF